MKSSPYSRVIAVLIGIWFVVALSASALHWIPNGPGQPPINLGLAVGTPLLIFLVWFAASAGFRQFLLNLSPRTLTFIQSWRIAGFTFVTLYLAGLLPGAFALPAGWGDIAIGLTAPFAALHLVSAERRKAFISWQTLGILDLVTAVGSGVAASLLSPHAVNTARMTVLPLSMIPTFAVPLFLMVHIVCIAQALKWKERNASPVQEQLPHLA
jgi:hypothetical protein